MRLNQFLEKLAMTPRTWFIADGCIRMRDFETKVVHCPISRVAHDIGSADGALGAQFGHVVWEDIGLSEQTAMRVLDSADNRCIMASYTTLRRRLLRACGLISRGIR